jgi:hypothetical protein
MIDTFVSFAKSVAVGEVEVYDEFSLQHELGVFLRSRLHPEKVQFERSVDFLGFSRKNFIKRETDIAVFSPDRAMRSWRRCAIELKYPRNGQYPEQMYSFCKDIAFIEQLRQAGFQRTFLVIFADDPRFYRGEGEAPYCYFRQERTLHGVVRKPTGEKHSQVLIEGRYKIRWHPIMGQLRYAAVEASIGG